MVRKITWLWILAFSFSIAYFFWTFAGLPEKVATHFDVTGNPNGFQTKNDYLVFFLFFNLLINLLFGVLYFSIVRIPVSRMNIPNKDYWLSNPEKTAELLEKLQVFQTLLAIYLNCVFLFAEHVVYQTNTPNAFFQIPVSGGIAFTLLGFIFLLIFIFTLLKPPHNHTKP